MLKTRINKIMPAGVEVSFQIADLAQSKHSVPNDGYARRNFTAPRPYPKCGARRILWRQFETDPPPESRV